MCSQSANEKREEQNLPPSLKVFYSYADEDIKDLEQLRLHLSPLRERNIILEFHRGMLKPGESRDKVKAYLKDAQLILLLISQRFFQEHFNSIEVQEIITHYLQPNGAGLPRVIPLLLHPVDLQEEAWLTRLVPLSAPKGSVGQGKQAEAAFARLALDIKMVIEDLRVQLYSYDVALSFAGEDRSYADALAETLRRRGLSVFYDTYEKSTLWGKNLYTYLSDVYQYRAHYCIMFLSQNYAAKLWTNHEREAAQARAFAENDEYILPVRLDKTKIPGLPPTVSYLSWPPETAETIADAIMKKLGKINKLLQEFDPENPDNFYSGK